MNPGGVLFSRTCVLCGARLAADAGEPRLCGSCLAPLMGEIGYCLTLPGEKTPCIAACRYADTAAAVRAFKFSGRREYAPTLGWLMALAYRRRAQGVPPCDAVTWVPVSTLRRISRGYDQSRLLAQETAALLGLPCLSLLRKRRHTGRQSRLEDDAARAANVRGVFSAKKPPEGVRRVLLIDDVVTSGATLREAAAVLKRAGIGAEALCFACARPETAETETNPTGGIL